MARKAPVAAPEEKLKRLLQEPLNPIYVLYGKERYFVRQAVKVIKGRILVSPELREMLYYPLYASETGPAELINLAQSVPFFDNTQLVLLWEAEKLKEPARKALLEYAHNPSETTCLVLVAADNLPKAALFQYLQKQWPKACIGFPPLNRAQRLKWVRQKVRENRITRHLSPGLLEDLIAGGHVTLETLEKQVEMLALYLEDSDAEGLNGPLPFLLPEIPAEQGYLLTDALLKGHESKSMELLHRFLESGTPSLLVLSRLAWEIRRILQIQEGMDRGLSPEDSFRSTRIPAFKSNLYLPLARKLPRKGLERLFMSLQEKDRELKSSRLDPAWHLEELCREIIRLVVSQNAADGRSATA